MRLIASQVLYTNNSEGKKKESNNSINFKILFTKKINSISPPAYVTFPKPAGLLQIYSYLVSLKSATSC